MKATTGTTRFWRERATDVTHQRPDLGLQRLGGPVSARHSARFPLPQSSFESEEDDDRSRTHYSLPKSIGPRNNQPVDDMLVAWFDKWLKGIDNGVDRLDPALLWNYGTERWVGREAWPPSERAISAHSERKAQWDVAIDKRRDDEPGSTDQAGRATETNRPSSRNLLATDSPIQRSTRVPTGCRFYRASRSTDTTGRQSCTLL